MIKKGRIEINIELCKGCEFCIVACPKALIEKSKSQNSVGYNYVIFDDKNEKCVACMLCGKSCPEAAIEVFEKICDCENCDCEKEKGG